MIRGETRSMGRLQRTIADRTALEKHVFAAFDGGRGSGSLPGLCLQLLAEQKETWADLRQAYASLEHVRTRRVRCTGFSVLLQHNPGRATSSLARVDEQHIRKRPCFLCVANLPGRQKGILYRGAYLILCNPAPVVPAHLTIDCVDHRAQAIADNIGTYLQLTTDFGPAWTLLYNGPACGASAPDHLHFQAVPSGLLPVERQVRQGRRLIVKARLDRVSLYNVSGLGRAVLLLVGREPEALARALARYVHDLKLVTHASAEPMLNSAGFYNRGTWRLLVFPRRKHRPDAFFAEGDARIAVSPAVMEMAGVIVTPIERDFERLDARVVERIYNEVSLDAETHERVLRTVCS